VKYTSKTKAITVGATSWLFSSRKTGAKPLLCFRQSRSVSGMDPEAAHHAKEAEAIIEYVCQEAHQ